MGDTRATAGKRGIRIILPPIACDVVAPTKAEPQFGVDVPLRPEVKLHATVVFTISVASSRPIIGANGMEADARQHGKGAARNDKQTAVIIPVIETVPGAPLTAKTVPHVNNRSEGNDFRPLIHTVEIAQPGTDIFIILGAAFKLKLTALCPRNVLHL